MWTERCGQRTGITKYTPVGVMRRLQMLFWGHSFSHKMRMIEG